MLDVHSLFYNFYYYSFALEKYCFRPCPMIYQPLCGSDGKTYSNKCEFEVADCLSDEGIKKIHDGECSKVDRGMNFLFGQQINTINFLKV
jgi:hypothetical protein